MELYHVVALLLLVQCSTFRLREQVTVKLFGVPVDPVELHNVLDHALPSISVTSRVVYDVNYRVVQLDSLKLNSLPALSVGDGTLVRVDVKGSEVEQIVDSEDRVVAIVNLSSTFKLKHGYCYSYGDESCSEQWVTQRGNLVVDLGAGPVLHGDFIHAEIEEKISDIMGSVGSSVVSAVAHVLVPSLPFDDLYLLGDEPEVIVPVLIFDNGEVERSIAKDAVVREISQMAHAIGDRHSNIRVLFKNVDAYQSRGVKTVIAGARRLESYFVPDQSSNHSASFKVSTREYLDSEWILDRALDASQGVLEGVLSKELGSTEAASAISRLLDNSEDHDEASDDILLTSLDVLILPVIVLHCRDNLFMDDDRKSVAASKHVVIVMHCGEEESLETGYFISYNGGFHRLRHSAQHTTKNIIAGVAVALGGVVPPFKDRSTIDWRFAHGHHPFGPFVGTISLNERMLSTIKRNSVLSYLDRTLQVCQSVNKDITAFAERFVYDPYLMQELLSRDSQGSSRVFSTWLHILYEYPAILESSIPTVAAAVREIYKKTLHMAHLLQEIQKDLETSDFALASHVAHEALRESIVLRDAVGEKIETVLSHLSCCHMD